MQEVAEEEELDWTLHKELWTKLNFNWKNIDILFLIADFLRETF